MAKAAGSLYRGPGIQVKGFGELSQAMLQRQALDNRLADAQNRAFQKQQEQLQKDAESVVNEYAAKELPAWARPIFGAFESNFKEAVGSGQIGVEPAIAYLGSLWGQMIGAQGDDFEAVQESINKRSVLEGYNQFNSAVSKEDFTMRAKDRSEVGSILQNKADYVDWGFFGMNADLASTNDYTTNGGWTRYWTIEEDQNGMPVLQSINGFYDANDDPLNSDSNNLRDMPLYGGFSQVYQNDEDFIVKTPVDDPSFFGPDLQAWNKSEFGDGQYHHEDTLTYIGNEYLNLRDENSMRARRTAFDFIQQKDGENALLLPGEELAFINNDPTMGGGDVAARTRRFERAKQRRDVQEYLASFASFEGKQKSGSGQGGKNTRADELNTLEADSNLFDISNANVNQTSFPVSLSNFDEYVQFNTGEIGKGSSLNPIRFENPDWGLDPYKFQQGQRVPVNMYAGYENDAKPILGPEVYVIKPEQLRIYNDGNNIIIGLQSYTNNVKNPEIFIKYNSVDAKDKQNQSLLEKAIDEGYKGLLTLDDFVKSGTAKLNAQAGAQPTFTVWAAQQRAEIQARTDINDTEKEDLINQLDLRAYFAIYPINQN
tara:strand:+ start:648 stop:2444 length:1797 start_codon:yes stop_codon:yes gene_type:complete